MQTADIVNVMTAGGGVMRAAALIRAGATREDLRRACRAEAILRVREGVYCTPGVDELVLAAAAHGGELACASVLRRSGIWMLDDEALLHVRLGPSGRRHKHSSCTCVSHYDGAGAAFGAVPIPRALVQTAHCLGAEVFFAALESAWRKGLVTRADRGRIREDLPAGMRWLVDIARSNADSGLESILRLRLHRLGIRLDSQVRIEGVGYVDFLLDGVIILEVDGKLNHDGRSERHRDLVRDAAAAASGYETLRFDYAMVIHDWPVVEKAILVRRARIRTLGRRGSS